MNKNNSPYSVDGNVQLTLASEFKSLGHMHNRFFGEFNNSGCWHPVPEVKGSLTVSCKQQEQSKLYQIDALFRISFSELENRNELDYYKGEDIILMYKTAGGQTKIAGTKCNPLTITISEPDGFDGYEITLKGTQTHPELYI